MIYEQLLSLSSKKNKLIIKKYQHDILSEEYIKESSDLTHQPHIRFAERYKRDLKQEIKKDQINGYFEINDSHFDLIFLPHRSSIDISIKHEINLKSDGDSYTLDIRFSYNYLTTNYSFMISIYKKSEAVIDSLNISYYNALNKSIKNLNVIYNVDKDNNFKLHYFGNTLDLGCDTQFLQDPDIIKTIFNNYLSPQEIKDTLIIVNDFDIDKNKIAFSIIEQANCFSKKIKKDNKNLKNIKI